MERKSNSGYRNLTCRDFKIPLLAHLPEILLKIRIVVIKLNITKTRPEL